MRAGRGRSSAAVTEGNSDMSKTKLDELIVDTLIEDYGWDSPRAEAAATAWHEQGAPSNDGSAVNIAERIYSTSRHSD
jgi:hypothetical protein